MLTNSRSFRADLQRLLRRLARLLQEIGDRHRDSAAHPGHEAAPTAYLRPVYLRLLQQATSLAQLLGVEAGEAPGYVLSELLAQLRASRHAPLGMSLQEALGG